MVAIAAAGALSYGARSTEYASQTSAGAIASFTDGRQHVITAHVVRDGMLRGERGRQTVDVETEEIAAADGTGSTERVIAGVRLGIYAREERVEEEDAAGGGPRVYRYGERVRFVGKLREPRNFGNPGQWDYRGYLADNGIIALGTARADRVEVLPGFSGNRFGLWRSRARQSVLAKIHALWPKEQAGLIDAMLIGERTYIDREMRTAFQRTGAYHILVVSGMNVGILAFAVFWLLRRVRMGETACSAVTLVLSCGYA